MIIRLIKLFVVVRICLNGYAEPVADYAPPLRGSPVTAYICDHVAGFPNTPAVEAQW